MVVVGLGWFRMEERSRRREGEKSEDSQSQVSQSVRVRQAGQGREEKRRQSGLAGGLCG